jgi:hypothetical protein
MTDTTAELLTVARAIASDVLGPEYDGVPLDEVFRRPRHLHLKLRCESAARRAIDALRSRLSSEAAAGGEVEEISERILAHFQPEYADDNAQDCSRKWLIRYLTPLLGHPGATQPAAPTAEAVNEFVTDVLSDVMELPDRTSPEDWPEACLVEGEELEAILRRRLSEDGIGLLDVLYPQPTTSRETPTREDYGLAPGHAELLDWYSKLPDERKPTPDQMNNLITGILARLTPTVRGER